jgi:predicted dehydrogenase
MATTAEQTGKFVAVGYQWSFSDAIQALKQDILVGVLGRPLRLKTKVFWPRPISYFQRADWAGRIRASDGQWILDSPAHNATGHYLHNMLYVLGDKRETSAWPVDVQAELYRANDIENFDAAAIRCHTRDGVEILFYTAHCIPQRIGPIFSYEFEQAVVEFEQDNGDNIIARFRDGRVKEYGDPNASRGNKLWQSIEAAQRGTPVACNVKSAIPQLVCLNGAQESMSEITALPQNVLKTESQGEDRLIWVEGLQESFDHCYKQGLLPSENADISWAKTGNIIDLNNYHLFPSFVLPTALK